MTIEENRKDSFDHVILLASGCGIDCHIETRLYRDSHLYPTDIVTVSIPLITSNDAFGECYAIQ